jgi:CopG family nickel-responsive transcriptional regulator
MRSVTRIGVSLEPDLLEEFDECISEKKYVSRSEAIRDLVRDSLEESRLDSGDNYVSGIIVTIFDTTSCGSTQTLPAIRKNHIDSISAMMNKNLGNGKVMEILIVSGEMQELKGLVSEISSTKGVMRSKLTTIAPDTFDMHNVR